MPVSREIREVPQLTLRVELKCWFRVGTKDLVNVSFDGRHHLAGVHPSSTICQALRRCCEICDARSVCY